MVDYIGLFVLIIGVREMIWGIFEVRKVKYMFVFRK